MPETEHYATTRAPEEVAAVAAERGLGNLIATREGPTRGQSARAAGAVAAACLVLLIPCWLVLSRTSPLSPAFSAVDAVYRALFIGMLGSLAWAIRSLLTGQRSWYLYAAGVIQKTGHSGPRAVAWPDAAGIRTIHQRRGDRNVGSVLGYRLAGRDGTTLTIPLKAGHGGRDPFIDQILAAAREHNCPIT
jgi:hypothetical protein